MKIVKPYLSAIKLITVGIFNYTKNTSHLSVEQYLKIVDEIDDVVVDIIESQFDIEYYRYCKALMDTSTAIHYMQTSPNVKPIEIIRSGSLYGNSIREYIETNWLIVDETIKVISRVDDRLIVEIDFLNYDHYFLVLETLDAAILHNESCNGNFITGLLPESSNGTVTYRTRVEIELLSQSGGIFPLINILSVEKRITGEKFNE